MSTILTQTKILTQKEKEVFNFLYNGLLYKEIACKQEISIDTVKKHAKNIYKKLNARNRTEAINNLVYVK